jgi:RNA polymerase sigma-70 factor (ECF subfamily)
MHHQQDIALVLRLREDDPSAYDALYLKYYRMLCVSAFFFLRNEQEAKDLVQNLFVDIWDKKLFLQFHDDVKGYLFRAVKNRCINHREKQQTQSRHTKQFAAMQDAYSQPDVDQKPENYEELYQALEDVPAQKRAALQIVYLHGKRYSEAALTMGISINSLKTHLRTGLRILRGEIKPNTD